MVNRYKHRWVVQHGGQWCKKKLHTAKLYIVAAAAVHSCTSSFPA